MNSENNNLMSEQQANAINSINNFPNNNNMLNSNITNNINTSVENVIPIPNNPAMESEQINNSSNIKTNNIERVPLSLEESISNPIPPVEGPEKEEIRQPMEKEKKPKKNVGKFVIILLVLISLGLAGYYGYKYLIKNNKEKMESKPKEEAFVLKKEDETKDYVYDADYTSVIDFDKNAGSCPISKTSLVVPYINLNSEDAKIVNREIKSLYEQAVGKYRANVTLDQEPCTIVKMAYKYYENNDVLSVVLAYAEHVTDLANPTFYTYNLSLKTGALIKDYAELKALSNQANSSDKDILDAIKIVAINKLASMSDTEYATVDALKEAFDFGVEPTTQATTWKEYCAALTLDSYSSQLANNTLKVYLGENNNLGFILVKYMPVGAGEINDMYSLK